MAKLVNKLTEYHNKYESRRKRVGKSIVYVVMATVMAATVTKSVANIVDNNHKPITTPPNIVDDNSPKDEVDDIIDGDENLGEEIPPVEELPDVETIDAKEAFNTLLDNLKNTTEYSISGNFDRDDIITLKQMKNATGTVDFEYADATGKYVLKNDTLYANCSATEKYKVDGTISFKEFKNIVHLEIGDDTTYPLQFISNVLGEAKDDAMVLKIFDDHYTLSFSHISYADENVPALPTGDIILTLNNKMQITQADIVSNQFNKHIEFDYSPEIKVEDSEFKLVNKHFLTIRKSILITGNKEKWDMRVNKEDGPEHYFYEKSGEKEYFGYKRIHYSNNYNPMYDNHDNCYYFYEDGISYYYDANSGNGFRSEDTSKEDFCAFVGTSDKLNFIKDLLTFNFDLNSIGTDITYKECYTVDHRDPNETHASYVYGMTASVRGDKGEMMPVYVVVELDGGTQLRNAYVYESKELADADSNIIEGTSQIDSWGAQKGNTSIASTQIGFYTEHLPTHDYILDMYREDITDVVWNNTTFGKDFHYNYDDYGTSI